MEKGEWITYTSKDEVDELAIILSWRGGCYHIDGNGSDAGKIEATEWKMRVQYREVGTSTWADFACPDDKDDDWYAHTDGGWGTKQKRTSEFTLLARLAFSSRKRYEVQIKGREDDTDRYRRVPTWIRTEELREEGRAYAGDALLAIEVMAQPQLSGGLPRVTALVRGRKVYVPTVGGYTWSRNPAWCLRDFLLDADNACGDWIASTDIADGVGGSWRTVAAACDANAASTGDHKEAAYQLDLVIDVHQPALDWANHMLGTFRSALVEYQGSLQLVQEKAASSTRTFDGRQALSSSNRPILMLDDGRADIRVEELNTDERPNVIKARFRDRANKFDQRFTSEVKDTVRLAAGDPEVRNEMMLAGVTRETQAIRQCRYVLNKARLTPRRVAIGVSIGDLDLLPSEVITVYSDNPPYDGALFLVEAVSYRDGYAGTLHCRQYDADVYADTVDTLPAAPAWLTHAQAIAKYRSPAIGAQSVTMSEVA
jgi:predicted phage tail protein